MSHFKKISLCVACAAGLLLSVPAATALQAGQPEVGKKMADFELSDLNDKSHKMSTILESNRVVLLVLRGFPGYQCPLCTRQVGSFLSAADQFAEQNTTVVMVYPGASDSIDKHAKEFIQGMNFPKNYVFLLDPDYKFLNANGLRWEGKNETSYPTTLIIDQKQMVQFAKISKSHGGRTKPKQILAELKK